MTNLSAQMQEKMTVRLNELRGKVLTKMTGAGERIKSRPKLKGDDSFKIVSDHQVMKQQDTLIDKVMFNIPGLSDAVEATIDVGLEMAENRKSTMLRPQDAEELSPKREALYRQQNAEDLRTFLELSERLEFLDCALAGGHKWGLWDKSNDSIALPENFTPEHEMKNDKGESQPANEIALNQAAVVHANRAMGRHLH